MKNAMIQLHCAVFLWGFTGVLGRLISLNEGLLVWYRMLITIVSLYFVMRAKKQLESVPPNQRFRLFLIGILLALHWCFFYGSIKYSNVSIALTCLSSTGLFTALLEPLITGRKLVPAEILLGIVAIVGIYLIFHFDPHFKNGIILGIIAAILTCIFSILNKGQITFSAPRTVMLYELSGGFLFLTLIMPFYLYLLPTSRLLPTRVDIVWLVALSWVCTILAMDLSLQALRKVSAFTQNLTLNLEPIYGILLAFVVYKENEYLSKGFYYGFALIILAVVLQMIRVITTRKVLQAQ